MLSLANLEAMRAGKYLYAGTLTPRIREKRGGANGGELRVNSVRDVARARRFEQPRPL